MSVTLVAQLMTTEVVTLNEDDDFVSADQVMRLQHVRHLPVVRGKKLVGLVTPSRSHPRAVQAALVDPQRWRRARG
jgi:CBS domain-containing protein